MKVSSVMKTWLSLGPILVAYNHLSYISVSQCQTHLWVSSSYPAGETSEVLSSSEFFRVATRSHVMLKLSLCRARASGKVPAKN